MSLDMNFLNRIRLLQRSYMTYVEKANMMRNKYGKASTAECSFLQGAANIKQELIQLTQGSGAEMLSHARDLEEINQRIEDIRNELEPGRAAERTLLATAASNSDNAEQKKSEADTEDDIKTYSWYQDMPKHSFTQVSGMQSVKDKLSTCMIETELEHLAKRLKMKILNSFFFIGPPGCGKTYIIKAFVHELMEKRKYNYLYLDCSQIITKYVGDSEKIVKKLFEEAVKAAPCILFIDEIDGMCKNRSNPALPEYASSLTTAFLTSYNIINEADKEIIFIGATNYPQNVDEAMLDRVEVVYVGLPDREARIKAFESAFAPAEGDDFDMLIHFGEGLNTRYMAACTRGYNYRDIGRLVENLKKEIFTGLADRLRLNIDNITPKEFVDISIEQLDNGTYVLTKEVFDSVLSSFIPSNKNKIIADIKEWMEEVRSDDESTGESRFPDISDHPDFSEQDEYEDYPDQFSEECINNAPETGSNEEPLEIEETDVVENDDTTEEVSDKEQPLTDSAAELKLIDDQLIAAPDGSITIRFTAPENYSQFLAVMVSGVSNTLITCTVEDNISSFKYTPAASENSISFRILDSSRFYGEITAEIQRGISDNLDFKFDL